MFARMRPFLKLDIPMKFLVGIYSVIIVTMVVFALASQVTLAIIAAIMFAVSDMFVARDRFVKHSPKNAFTISTRRLYLR